MATDITELNGLEAYKFFYVLTKSQDMLRDFTLLLDSQHGDDNVRMDIEGFLDEVRDKLEEAETAWHDAAEFMQKMGVL